MPDIVDVSQVEALAASLRAAGPKVTAALRPTTARAALNIKNTMREDASGHSHLGALPQYVEYELEQSGSTVEAEIGFRKEGQGNLANIAAFGTKNNAPVMDITRGIADETPEWLRHITEAAAKALL